MHRIEENCLLQNEQDPLITIITVVRNGEKTIEHTIKSVLAQKNRNVEFIVIDGCSDDGTVDILRRYKDTISYWVSEPDQGIYDAMNKGWQIAKDGYILFLGSGDQIVNLPTVLDSSHAKKIYYGKVMIGSKLFKSRLNFRFKMGNTLHHQALLIPKSACDASPFDLRYKVYADYNFSVKLLKDDYIFIYSEDFSSIAIPNGISSTEYIREMLNIVSENFGFFWMSLAFTLYLTKIIIFRFIKRQEYKFSFR
jgi:glycosyltransferase involved in cell wall biosynthesis